MHFSRRLFFHTASLKHDISIAYRTKALYSPSPLLLLPWSTWKLKTRREMAQNFLASAVPSSNWQGCSSLSQKRVQDKYEPENWSCKNQMLASETTWQLSRCRSTAWFSSALATLSVRYCYSIKSYFYNTSLWQGQKTEVAVKPTGGRTRLSAVSGIESVPGAFPKEI